MSVQTDPFAVHDTTSPREADSAAFERLEQEVADLDARILAAVRRRSDLARSLAAASPASGKAEPSAFDELGPDGPSLDRLLMRLSGGLN